MKEKERIANASSFHSQLSGNPKPRPRRHLRPLHPAGRREGPDQLRLPRFPGRAFLERGTPSVPGVHPGQPEPPAGRRRVQRARDGFRRADRLHPEPVRDRLQVRGSQERITPAAVRERCPADFPGSGP